MEDASFSSEGSDQTKSIRYTSQESLAHDQVSLSEGWVRPISYKTGRRRMATAQPKERIVPLTDRARAEFEKLLAKSEDDNVFPYRSVKKSWATVCRTASVKGFWLRWLRDEAENRCREAGMHPLGG